VFSASQGDVLRFAGRRPRPFPLAADPTSGAHETYGIERSPWRKLKAIVTRVPTLLKGMRLVGLAGLNTSTLMPADFLIDGHGRIVDAYYGSDAGDRVPLERVKRMPPREKIRAGGLTPPLAAVRGMVHHAGTATRGSHHDDRTVPAAMERRAGAGADRAGRHLFGRPARTGLGRQCAR
jgi:hypothetical protein